MWWDIPFHSLRCSQPFSCDRLFFVTSGLSKYRANKHRMVLENTERINIGVCRSFTQQTESSLDYLWKRGRSHPVGAIQQAISSWTFCWQIAVLSIVEIMNQSSSRNQGVRGWGGSLSTCSGATNSAISIVARDSWYLDATLHTASVADIRCSMFTMLHLQEKVNSMSALYGPRSNTGA